jgi:hypothetical protein
MYVLISCCYLLPANFCKTGHGGVFEGPQGSKAQPFIFHAAKSDDDWGVVAGGAWKTVGDRCKILQLLTCALTNMPSSPESTANHHVYSPRQICYHI